MSAPSVPRAGKRRERMPAPHQMPTVHEARDRLADLEERITRGEQVDPVEWAAAEARVDLAAKEGEIAERVRRRERQASLEAAAADGEAWLATEAPPLAATVVEAMAAAAEATRALVAALADYQSGADRAMGKIGRVRHAPSDVPHGRRLLDAVLAEVQGTALGRPAGYGTPVSEQLRRVASAAPAPGTPER